MTEEQEKQFEAINERFNNWWGWEDGYTHEEKADFMENIADRAMGLLATVAGYTVKEEQ